MDNQDMTILQKAVLQGVRNVIRSHTLLFSATGKPSAEKQWNELTNGITNLRRTLSKLETNAYDTISTRFERVNVPKYPSDSYISDDSSSNNHSQMENLSDDILLLIEDELEGKYDVLDSEIEKESSMVVSEMANDFPPPQLFEKGDKFLAKVLSAVSPLEFYVIKVAQIKILRNLERLISYCSEELCNHSLLDSQCHQDLPCLVRFEDVLARAKIGHGSTYELQVYLIDYGRSMFISRSECFAMPTFIAKYAPPLAHFCTLNDVDSRALDHATVKAFHEKLLSLSEITLECFGESRRTHGELVDLVD